MSDRAVLRDKIYWAVTLLYSALGTCDRLLTASSAEKNKRLVGLGHNGSLPGQPHCDDEGHTMVNGHCERTRHGEMNLKDNTDQDKFRDSKVRVLGTPCLRCLKESAGGGVNTVEYTGSYDNQEFQPTPELLKGILGGNFTLTHRDIDWTELFQEIFDKLSGPGGVFSKMDYRIRIVKEPKEGNHERS